MTASATTGKRKQLKRLTKEQLEVIGRMRELGLSWAKVSHAIGRAESTCRLGYAASEQRKLLQPRPRKVNRKIKGFIALQILRMREEYPHDSLNRMRSRLVQINGPNAYLPSKSGLRKFLISKGMRCRRLRIAALVNATNKRRRLDFALKMLCVCLQTNV
jgi:hypothetical protein